MWYALNLLPIYTNKYMYSYVSLQKYTITQILEGDYAGEQLSAQILL